MAPFHQALDVSDAPTRKEGDSSVYEGDVDGQWSVVAVPHGGYVLALLLEACMKHQAKTAHPDPLHVTAHFLRATTAGPFGVRVRIVRTGRAFANLHAEFFQGPHTNVSSHLIFGSLAPTSTTPGFPSKLSILPPSPFAPRIPLLTHPATPGLEKGSGNNDDRYSFASHMRMADDRAVLARNALDHPARVAQGGDGLEWAAWLGFRDARDVLTTPSLALFADMFTSMPPLLPKEARRGWRFGWFPTMVMTLEFKARVPQASSSHAARTVGVYSKSRFLGDPQGRHDTYCEVWTAPSDIDDPKGPKAGGDNWREGQICLAVSTQMALTMASQVTVKKEKEGGAKL